MSKIVQAVNAMISNPDNISDVIKGDKELFFLYKGKYKWSVRRDGASIIVYYYPGDQSLGYLANCDETGDWDGVDMVIYNDSEIGTKEAKASFAELYMVIKEQVFGVNKVLDDIIADADLI